MRSIQKFFLLSVILIIADRVQSQSMADIFRLLPEDCTPDLDSKQRDTLLQIGKYVLPGGDSSETIEYELDSSGFSDYIYFVWSFTTGQRGFIQHELRKFKKNDGGTLIIYSKYGGTPVGYDQRELIIFDYKNNKLTINKKNLLPKEIPITSFLKPNTPSLVVKKIQNEFSSCYHLNPENPKTITFEISPYITNDDEEKYIIGYTIPFVWNGRSFTRKPVKD